MRERRYANSFTRSIILELLKQDQVLTEFTSERPTKWHPSTVVNPETGAVFSPTECWEFIKELVRRGHPIEEMVLDHPEGATGYVMIVPGESVERDVYIKLEIVNERTSLIGRSFHYSTN